MAKEAPIFHLSKLSMYNACKFAYLKITNLKKKKLDKSCHLSFGNGKVFVFFFREREEERRACQRVVLLRRSIRNGDASTHQKRKQR